MATRSCAAIIKDNGQPCKAPPLRDGPLCLMHAPEHADEVAEGRRLGGLRRRKEATLAGAYDFVGFETAADILRALEIAMYDILYLENSIPRARTIGYLAGIGIRALETGQHEDRITALETALASRFRGRRRQWQ